jgi:hypothetical protein
MKKFVFLLIMSISLSLAAAEQPPDTIHFNGECLGTINGPGTWGIVPNDVATCIDGWGSWRIHVNKTQERAEGLNNLGPDSQTEFGVFWNSQTQSSWVFPDYYSGGSTGIQQFVKLSNPGYYSVHNQGPLLGLYVNFLSDPFITVDGDVDLIKPHLTDWEVNDTIKICASNMVELEINSIFAPPLGGNKLSKNGTQQGQENQTSYQIISGTNSDNYIFRYSTYGNQGGAKEINFKVIITSTTYTLTPSSGPNGNISPNTVVTVNQGGSQTFNFTPLSGYEVDQVKVDNVSVSFNNNQYTFMNVQSNHTINVTFKYYNAVDELNTEQIQTWYHQDHIYFKNLLPNTLVQIYDVQGRIIYQTIPATEIIPFTNKGFYIIKLTTRDSVETKKMVVY